MFPIQSSSLVPAESTWLLGALVALGPFLLAVALGEDTGLVVPDWFPDIAAPDPDPDPALPVPFAFPVVCFPGSVSAFFVLASVVSPNVLGERELGEGGCVAEFLLMVLLELGLLLMLAGCMKLHLLPRLQYPPMKYLHTVYNMSVTENGTKYRWRFFCRFCFSSFILTTVFIHRRWRACLFFYYF